LGSRTPNLRITRMSLQIPGRSTSTESTTDGTEDTPRPGRTRSVMPATDARRSTSGSGERRIKNASLMPYRLGRCPNDFTSCWACWTACCAFSVSGLRLLRHLLAQLLRLLDGLLVQLLRLGDRVRARRCRRTRNAGSGAEAVIHETVGRTDTGQARTFSARTASARPIPRAGLPLVLDRLDSPMSGRALNCRS
jgi:hypothetical protein